VLMHRNVIQLAGLEFCRMPVLWEYGIYPK
jgi:hypothetical protein